MGKIKRLYEDLRAIMTVDPAAQQQEIDRELYSYVTDEEEIKKINLEIFGDESGLSINPTPPKCGVEKNE